MGNSHTEKTITIFAVEVGKYGSCGLVWSQKWQFADRTDAEFMAKYQWVVKKRMTRIVIIDTTVIKET